MLDAFPAKCEEVELDDIPDDSDNTHKLVDDCLDCLDDYDRQIVEGYFFDGCTYEELAEINCCSIEWIRRRIKKSLTRMKLSQTL